MKCIIKKCLFIGLLSFTSISMVQAQYYGDEEKTENSQSGKFYISPDFGLILGSITMIEVAPALGYQISPQFSAGLGLRYEYYRQLDSYTRDELINTSKYGIRGFSKLILIPDIGKIIPISGNLSLFAYAEVESLNLETKYYGQLRNTESLRFWYTSVLTGGGIAQQVTERSFVNFMLLWDINSSSGSPYSNPVLRVGIQIYLK